jgi:uncharacterized protein (TIGR00255 family)
MTRSMTGFSRRTHQAVWGTLVFEVRTVNHRYLEVSLRLPENFKPFEQDIRQLIGAVLRRGKVDAALYLKPVAGEATALDVDSALLARVLERLGEIRSRMDAAAPVSPMELLRWPGILREAEADMAPILAAAMELVREGLADLNAMRGREGSRIHDALVQRCDAMRGLVAAVRLRLPEVTQRLRARLLERIGQVTTSIDPARLEQELVMYAHKMDVDEELDRLDSHLTEITTVLGSKDPAGRRLDFLMQELNREANTLSSKSQDVETTRAAVDMKVIIEQLREQIQNLE